MRTLLILVSVLIFHHGMAQEADSTKARAWLRKGLAYKNAGNYDSSFLAYEMGVTAYRPFGKSMGLAEGLYGQGLALHYLAKSKEALPLYMESLSVFEEMPAGADRFIADLYSNIGACHIDLGNRMVARTYLEKGLEERLKLYGSSHRLTGSSYYNLGLSSMYFGEYQASLAYFMDALPIYLAEYGEYGSRVAQLYTNVGILHRDLGDFEMAKEYFGRAISIHLRNHGESYWNLAYPYANLGEVYENQDHDSTAAAYYHQALALTFSEDRDLTRLRSILFGMLGKLHGKTGNYDQGLAYCEDAIALMKETFHDDHPKLNEFYRIKGNIYKQKGDYAEANKWYEYALENVQLNYGEKHPMLARAYLEQSEVYLDMRSYSAASSLVDKGINALQVLPSPEQSSSLNSTVLDEQQMVRMLAMKGRVIQAWAADSDDERRLLDQALHVYKDAAQAIDKLRQGYLSESAKIFLQDNSIGVYESALEVIYRLHDLTSEHEYLNDALFFMEKNKAVVLSEALQFAGLVKVQGVPESVLQREKELAHYVRQTEIKLADLGPEDNDSLINNLTDILFTTRRSLDSLNTRIEEQFPQYHQLKYSSNVISLKDYPIRDNTLHVSFFEGDSFWYQLCISSERRYFRRIPKTELSDEEVLDLQGRMADPASSLAELNERSYSLFRRLLGEILTSEKNIHHLVIIPDGPLGYLPFDALVTTLDKSVAGKIRPSYMIDKYTISYAPSLSLLLIAGTRHESLRYAGFAPSYAYQRIAPVSKGGPANLPAELQGTREEVTYAGKLFSGDIFMHERATEYNFKHLENPPAILHLAMHGMIDDRQPMRSSLLFSTQEDTVEDGFLYAYEVYSLALNAELAVLSACNTGAGAIKRGEGIMSLSRAFMYAGCPNIVMSLWTAQDNTTSGIIRSFFDKVNTHSRKDDALRFAKLEYLSRADPLKSHPAYWATLVFVGNSDPVDVPDNFPLWLSGLLSALLFTAVIVLFNFRRFRSV